MPAVPFNRHALNSIIPTNSINWHPSSPTVQTIPTSRQHPKSIAQTVPIIDSLHNQWSGQFQEKDSLQNQLPGQFQFVDSLVNQLPAPFHSKTVSNINCPDNSNLRRRSRHNVVQMHGTIREDRTSPVNPTWTGHRMVCNLWQGVYYSSPHQHSDVPR